MASAISVAVTPLRNASIAANSMLAPSAESAVTLRSSGTDNSGGVVSWTVIVAMAEVVISGRIGRSESNVRGSQPNGRRQIVLNGHCLVQVVRGGRLGRRTPATLGFSIVVPPVASASTARFCGTVKARRFCINNRDVKTCRVGVPTLIADQEGVGSWCQWGTPIPMEVPQFARLKAPRRCRPRSDYRTQPPPSPCRDRCPAATFAGSVMVGAVGSATVTVEVPVA